MKKLILIIAVVAMMLPSCEKIEDVINALDSRVTQLEGEKIPSVEQQIESINTSIADLEAVDVALKEQISELEKNDESTAEEISNLKAKDAELEQMINTLQEYVNSLNQGTKDWISTTYATLEQFNSLSVELADLKTLLENYKDNAATNLSSAISALESSMKSWVNSQLANYYTIAQIDAKIEALQGLIQQSGSEELISELNLLKSSLQTMKTELTAAYTEAIEEAINTNNGVINAKIASEITAVNNRINNEVAAINAKITAIESRLDDLEDKVDDLLNRKLEITFDNTDDIAVIAGESCKVNYTITSSESEVHIATIAQNGWKASVTKSTEKTGYITVYAPNPLTTEPIIVLVSDANTTIMRSLTFVYGVTTIATESYAITNEATTLSVNVTTNLNYTVNIPSSASSWISLQGISTRATVRNDVINLNIKENTTTSSRTATLQLVCDNVEVGTISIYQQGIAVANNELVYTSSDGKIIEPYQTIGFNANIVSNTYSNGRGLIVFDKDITAISEYAFYNCTKLTSVKMPNSVTNIKEYAFYGSKLNSVEISTNTTTVGEYAFYKTAITNIVIPNKVTSIGAYAFYDCSLSALTIGESVEVIGGYAFYSTDIKTITIPNNVSSIGANAFEQCSSLTSVIIGRNVKSIGMYAFSACSNLTSVYCNMVIPSSVDTDVFYNANINLKIYVYDECYNTYKNQWLSWSSKIVANGPIQDSASLPTATITYKTSDANKLNIDLSKSFVVKEHTYSGGVGTIVVYGDAHSIVANQFYQCALTNITMPNSITSIGATAFYGCGSLTSVTFGNGVTRIADSAFRNCSSLSSVTIPDSVTYVGGSAFRDCSSLTSVTIGNSVTTIGNRAFENCWKLKNFYCKPATPPYAGGSYIDNIFYDVARTGFSIYVPTASLTAYENADDWKYYSVYIKSYNF